MVGQYLQAREQYPSSLCEIFQRGHFQLHIERIVDDNGQWSAMPLEVIRGSHNGGAFCFELKAGPFLL